MEELAHKQSLESVGRAGSVRHSSKELDLGSEQQLPLVSQRAQPGLVITSIRPFIFFLKAVSWRSPGWPCLQPLPASPPERIIDAGPFCLVVLG